RLGWYPLSFVGIEGEAMAARSKSEGDGSATNFGNGARAMLFSGRGQLVVQAPLAYVVPFFSAGVGKLGVIGRSVGTDTDVDWDFGLGARAALRHALSLRLALRDNLTAKPGRSGQANPFEAMLGLTAVIERARKEPPPPPADSDHDGVLDPDDKCPAEAGA